MQKQRYSVTNLVSHEGTQIEKRNKSWKGNETRKTNKETIRICKSTKEMKNTTE